MKRISKLALFGLLIVTLSLIGTVLAEDEIWGGLTTNTRGTVWRVDFSALSGSYTADDVNLEVGITANAYLTSAPSTPESLTIRDAVVRNGQLVIYFKGVDLPIESVDTINVLGEFNDGATFKATGPGFAWARR